MNAIIKPTVGRVVWFHPAKAPSSTFAYYSEAQPCAATVAYVWSDRMVNLSVVDHAGVQHNMTSVPFVQPGDKPLEHAMWCEWMPYQIGQAKVAA